jgi:uncharacterized lipoprotein YddW (UPF0748 family)
MRGPIPAWAFMWAMCTWLLAGSAMSAQAQPRSEVRGFWVDTFNTTLNNPVDVAAVVDRAVAANANTIFAQVRRRGDSWYLNSLEPLADRTPIQPGFDPLENLIVEAHARGLEVHAFVIANAIWNRAPSLFPPTDPNHVFNRHGGYDPVTNTITPGPDNWLTRTLIPDGTASITLQGHRFGSEFYIDPGHPDAASHTVQVLTHLVLNYDIDGLHLDRIRYPEIGIAGQTPATGTSVGYNAVSIARFQRRFGIPPDSPPPAQNDPRWSQWRRDQVTNLVRRVYLDAVAIRPHIKVSGAFIAFGSGPTSAGAWQSAEAYWRVYQDWRAWTEEGIIDVAIPMIYQRDHLASGRTAFNQWNDWVRSHQYARSAMMGIGSFLNSIEGTLAQVRRALAPSGLGHRTLGVNFFSMATSNVAVPANPLSIPPGQNTPARPFADFAAGLVTGRSANGAMLFEDPVATPVAIFDQPAAIPGLSWKTDPQVGHLRGVIRDESGEIVDTGTVAIQRVADATTPAVGRFSAATASDGGGFYGGVDLAPGEFGVTVTPVGRSAYTTACTAAVTAGHVTTFDITIDRTAPAGALTADPAVIWPPNQQMVTVTLSGDVSDVGTGLDRVRFRVVDEYGSAEPSIDPVIGGGQTTVGFTRTFQLEASRHGNDRDGRIYTLEATVTDRACNVTTLRTTVVVLHDRHPWSKGSDRCNPRSSSWVHFQGMFSFNDTVVCPKACLRSGGLPRRAAATDPAIALRIE